MLRLNTVLMKETMGGLDQVINMAALLGIVEVSLIPLVCHGQGWASKEHSVSALAVDEVKSLISQAKKLAKERNIELVSGISTERHLDTIGIGQLDIPKCYRSIYIQSNGDLSPCCSISLRFGNVFEEELADILSGRKMSSLRTFVQHSKPSCHDCVNFAYSCLN